MIPKMSSLLIVFVREVVMLVLGVDPEVAARLSRASRWGGGTGHGQRDVGSLLASGRLIDEGVVRVVVAGGGG
jgi:hypothetical protein